MAELFLMVQITFKIYRLQAESSIDMESILRFHIQRSKVTDMLAYMYQSRIQVGPSEVEGRPREWVEVNIDFDSANSFITASGVLREYMQQKIIEDAVIDKPLKLALKSTSLGELLAVAKNLGLQEKY